MLIRFMFVSEGSTDTELVPHLEALCLDAGASEAEGVAPDLASLPEPPGKTVEGQVQGALDIVGDVDILFVHRDADTTDPGRALAAIQGGTAAFSLPCVPVVPIQETEAWLLTDERAIREVAGDPSGSSHLNLPAIRRVESTSNPKEVLRDALERACPYRGRRLREFKRNFGHHRRVLLQRLDTSGPVSQLKSWQHLVEATRHAVNAVLQAST